MRLYVFLIAGWMSIASYASDYDPSKWTNISIYNSGGYSSWYETEWYDKHLGTVRNKKSGTNTAGYTHTFDYPPHAQDIRIKGYTLTGLVWQPNKLIFDKYIGHGDQFSTSTTNSAQYYKIKVWGTTLSPSWAPISASLPSDFPDPYSRDDASACSKLKNTYSGNNVALMNPLPYTVEAINKCRFTVKIIASNENNQDRAVYILKPNERVEHYYRHYKKYAMRHSVNNRDAVFIYEHGDFTGVSFSISDNQAKLPPELSGKMSSFAIPQGWRVRFYEGENFKGRYWTRDSQSSDHKFAKDFNDIIRSVEILEKP